MVGETIDLRLTISLRCGEPFLEIDADIAWFWRTAEGTAAPGRRDNRAIRRSRCLTMAVSGAPSKPELAQTPRISGKLFGSPTPTATPRCSPMLREYVNA